MSLSDNRKLLFSLFERYGLDANEKDELLSIIDYIFRHDEFQRRFSDEFMHHDNITLGEHILEVAIYSYVLYKKHKNKNDIDLDILLKIAMFHDLYTEPWQNNPNAKVEHRIHKHIFRHPIEAAINSCTWFPADFSNLENANIIIDGVVHHMAPIPVLKYAMDDENFLELRNFDNISLLSSDITNLLQQASDRLLIGNFSFSLSKNLEGKIVNISDKIVSFNNMKHSNISGFLAILTEKNDNLVRHKKR